MRNNKFLKINCVRTLSVIGLMLFNSVSVFAHDGSGDFFQNIGKIYVVVTVVLISFIGIIIFLIALERRIKKLEDSIK